MLNRAKRIVANVNYDILILLSCIGLCILFWWISLGEWDLVFATLMWAFFIYIVPEEVVSLVIRLEWFKKIIKSRIFFSLSFATGFGMSALVSGGWNPDYKVGEVFIGPFHVHHWFTHTFRLILLLPIFTAFLKQTMEERELIYLKRSKIEFLISIFMMSLFLPTFIWPSFFKNPESVKYLSGALTTASLALGMILKSETTRRPGFKRVLASFLGISLGIWAEGLIDLIQIFPAPMMFFK